MLILSTSSNASHPRPTESLRLACAALHLVGGLLGFSATKASGFDEKTCRTVAIDAGTEAVEQMAELGTIFVRGLGQFTPW